jgi:hypothetical protein
MSFVLIIGGYLNLFQLVNRFTIHVILVIGIVSFVFVKKSKSNDSSEASIAALKISEYAMIILSSLGTLYIYIISCLNKQYNSGDDFEGYFSFVSKLLQTGSLGNDPFSARRMVSSLGGQTFLDSLTLTFNSVDFLHVTDSGLGLLILLSTTFSYYRMKKWRLSSNLVLVFCIAAINPLAVNITSIYTLSAIIFVLITFILKNDQKNKNDGLIPFLVIASAGATLKNTALLVIVLFSTLYFVKLNCPFTRTSKAIKNLLQGVLVVIISIFPWCRTMYLSNGTYLYPILGKGFHGSRYGYFNYTVNVASWEFIKPFIGSIIKSPLSTPLLIFSLVVTLSMYSSKTSFSQKVTLSILYLIVLFNYIVIAIGSSNFGPFRYNFPFLFALTIAVLQFTSLSNSRKLFGLFASSVLVSVIFIGIAGQGAYSSILKINPKPSLNTNIYPTQSRISSIQNVIPLNTRAVLRTGYNFMFDFKRNKLLIVDYPGESSPPPGIPLFSTSDDLKSYLLGENIQYLIFQYKGLFDKETYGDRLNPSANAWLRIEAENAFAFEDSVLRLAESNTVIYRDTKFIVIELNTQRG